MSSVDSITITSVSTVNQITITDSSGITVTTVGTQGLAGPSAIMARGINQNTAGASNNGAMLIYDHSNVKWTANDTTEGKQSEDVKEVCRSTNKRSGKEAKLESTGCAVKEQKRAESDSRELQHHF